MFNFRSSMGHEGVEFKSSFSSWNTRSILLFLVGCIACIVVTAVITYVVTRNATLKESEEEGGASFVIPEQAEVPGPSGADLRLPKSLEPQLYRLRLKTWLPGYGTEIPAQKNLTFEGQLSIDFTVVEKTQSVVVNAKELNFTNIHVRKDVGGALIEVPISEWQYNDELEKLTADLQQPLLAGDNITVEITYAGKISSNLGGLYQAKYEDNNKVQKIAAVTQMEPTDARRMVPCLDEPAYKAKWAVTVIHPLGTQAVSNGIEQGTPKELEENGLKWHETTFKETPKMSSYLLAVFISEFKFVEGVTQRGIRMRVWSRPEMVAFTNYSLESGIKVLTYYEDFYGINFPLEKLDMVALPDFSAGAMENWGLVTYRETALLYDPALYGMAEKQRVAVVVAHELAHQWFGNLVTMAWWEDLWLNEGFATLVENIGASVISDQKFRMSEQFVAQSIDTVMVTDALATSHPLSFKIEKSIEVEEAFDAITYDKGGSVLSMIRAVMGENVFQDGLKSYLKKNAYGNAEAADLWSALDEAAGNHSLKGANGKPLKISHFASLWTTQMGYPVVNVQRVNETTVRLTQERFKLMKDMQEKKKYRTPKYGFKWDVPIWYQTGKDSQQLTWLERDGSITLSVPAGSAVVVNSDSQGFYRGNYDEQGWKLISQQLNEDHTIFSSKTRTRLISDAFALAEDKKISYESVYGMMRYMKNEKDPLPWEEFAVISSQILRRFGTEPEVEYYKRYMRSLVSTAYQDASLESLNSTYWDDDKHLENLRDTTLIKLMCRLGDTGCLEMLTAQFQKGLVEECKGRGLKSSQCSRVPVPLRSNIYCYGVKYGPPSSLEFVQSLYLIEDVQLERDALLSALTCTSDITQLKQFLLKSLDKTIVRLQDLGMLYKSASGNPVAELFLYDFLKEHWRQIQPALGSSTSILGRLISACTSNIRTEKGIRDLIAWRKTEPEAMKLDVFNQQIASAYRLTQWVNDNQKTLGDYFANAAPIGAQ